jgi:mannose-1-phosphate guanylyltransferase
MAERSPPWAMILAAGFGTRLRPLTEVLPKPLVPLGDRPVLAHIATRLHAAGVRAAAINTHHEAGAFTQELLARLPLRLEVIREPKILGTAGGLANAARWVGGVDALVWNGDIVAEVDASALVAAHDGSATEATLVVAPSALGQGTVGLGAQGEVVRLRGERFGDEVSSGDFLGIQVVSAALIARLPERGCLVGDGYLPALREGLRLGSFRFHEPWGDIGSLVSYLDANLRWLAARGVDAHVGPGARVGASVSLEASVVGEGAVVEGAGPVRRAVIWPGARARAPLADVVVMGSGQVVPVGLSLRHPPDDTGSRIDTP